MEGRPPHAELVRRAQRGDIGAFEDIVRAHQDIAFRTAFVITGSAEDAADATQDAFIKAHRALGRFDATRPVRPWLLAIVGNEARNRARAAGRRRAAELRLLAATPSGDAAPSPEATVIDGSTRDELLAALDILGVDERRVIACRYFAGLSEAETSRALGVRPGTVKSRHSRALARLRAHLGDVDG